MKELISEYRKNKARIKSRLKDFQNLYRGKDRDLFAELCFCILTPQSKAISCDSAIKELRKKGLLFEGAECDIKNKLKGRARFHNKKAAYLVAARNVFRDRKGFGVKNKIDRKDVLKTRDWLVRNIKGLGYKEASHFLRNIGLGKGVAIIDRHILKNLKALGVIKKIPCSVTKKNYLEIEEKMGEFAREIGIPLEELDLLFWSAETGFIFK